MKKLLLFSLFVSLITLTANAQIGTCVPDETYRDSVFGVYPPPLSAANPDGGITTTACQNQGWEFAITVKIPETIVLNGAEVPLYSLEVETQGAVENLPTGMTYSCNPPDCKFEPTDTLGCINIYGTTSDPVGDYDLKINTVIFSLVTPTGFAAQLPSNIIPGADGNYFLTVVEETDPNCVVANIDALLAEKFQINNVPNPFGNSTNIEIYAEQKDELEFKVYDVYGKELYSAIINVIEGDNSFNFDGSRLTNGIYVYTIGKDGALVSEKMIVNRR